MTRIRCLLSLLLGIAFTTDASAQFLPVFGLPVVGQNGISFHMGGRGLRIDGFFPTGNPYTAIVPVTPTPFGYRQVGPAYLPYGYGAIDQRITVQIINPPGLSPRAGLRPVPDLSGIDLDLQPASAIWGEKPALAKAPPAKKVEVAAKAPPLPALPKAEVIPEGKRLNDLGVTAFRNADYGLATLRFRQAVDADQPMPRALFLQAQAYIAVGKYRDAVETIQQGLKLDPNWPASGFRPKVELYEKRDDEWKEHRERLEQTQAKQPKNADNLLLLGYLAWFDGQRGAAVDYFTQSRALAAEPRWADAFLKAK